MSKYIDADKLIDGIKHIQGKFPVITYDALLHLVTSLQQEQPEVDLEKEFDKYYGMYRDKTGKTYDIDNDEPCMDWKEDGLSEHKMRLARHFWDKGYNARKSIWHNVAEEMPTKNGLEVIVACRNKNKEDGIWLYDLIQCWEGKWEPRVNWETPVKWAYVRDLDNAGENADYFQGKVDLCDDLTHIIASF